VARLTAGWPAALLPAAAFTVHQLRYVLAYGDRAGAMLARTGHSYLHSLVPWVVLALALAAGGLLRSLGRALSGQTTFSRYTVSFAGLWLLCTLALVATFAGQELLEGLAATGHTAGWSGIFGFGGWWAIPAAACVALVLAAFLHGARWALGELARLRSAGRERPHPTRSLRLSGSLPGCAPAPLIQGWSGRGPPPEPSTRAFNR
jgi:hypothetical protein